ncbi:MAG: TonB-dependent receptor, partial [Bacteroidota bacterium]
MGKSYDLEERTFQFAKDCRFLMKSLKKTIQNIEDSKQLVRSSGSVGANYIEANEPDRRTNTAFIDEDGNYRPAQGTAGFNHRFYSELQEDDYAAKAELAFDLNSSDEFEYTRNLRAGYNFRYTNRNFIFRQFNANILRQGVMDLNNIDSYFNQETLTNGDFELQTDAGTRIDSFGREVSTLFPFFYIGDRLTHSGYFDGVYQFNDKLTLNLGLRYDRIDQAVDYDTALVSSVNSANPDETAILLKDYILPSFNVKYQVNENLVLRTAGSISYTLPQFREVAPFVYEGINFTTIGNPSIDASENYNIDAKGEYYFGEEGNNLVTLTAFYKYIDSPINRVGSNSAANQLTFVNVPEAEVLGIEVEFKADLFRFENMENETENSLSLG